MDPFRALSTVASTGAPTRFVLVRHGATEHTAAGRYSGRGLGSADVALSAAGAAQAAAAAARIATEFGPVAAVASSPLRRCRDTAGPVAAACGLAVTAEPDLVECDFGRWEGLTFGAAASTWPAEHAAWLASTAIAPPGG